MPNRRFTSFLLLFAAAVLPVLLQAQTPMQFIAIAPCRVVDTRNPVGPFGGPSIPGQSSRDFALPDGACSIPATAAAYALNVTVVPHGILGYLTVWPAGQSKPVISTLNSLDGRIKANAAIVPAGTAGGISVYATNTTDVVVDVNGYFAPASVSTLAFFPLTPCRVADTRWATGTFGGPYLSAARERIFPVLSSSCTIPNGATGYSLNFTVVPHGVLGYLTVWPTGQQRPLVSTLNALTGTITANAAIMPAGQVTGGAISVYPTDDTDLVIDINGYFAPSDTAPGPLSLYTLPPCRVLDTRPGSFTGMLPVGVLQSPCNVPSAQAYAMNATVVPKNNGFYGYLTLWPDAEGRPVVSTLNAIDGMITSNMAIVPTLNGNIDAYASNLGDLVLDIFSYFAPIGPLNILTTGLPSAAVGYSYTTTVAATGGIAPYSWSITSGSLPPGGLTLDPATGVIAGTPSTEGDYPFTVQVTDSATPPATSQEPFDITVNNSIATLTIATTTLPSGTQNAPYNAVLAATGGLTPYTWSIASGSLPSGLHLNSSTGAITGTPAGAGVSNFTVQVTDSQTPTPATANTQLSVTISPAVPLSISTASLPGGTVGTPYSASLTGIGGVYPYTWSLTLGQLPAGLTLNSSTGVISGTPTLAGTANFSVEVTDAETPPVSATAPLAIIISPPPPLHITTTLLPDGTAGSPYTATVTATGGLHPYTWSVAAGKLPDGLTLNSSTGVISGTPLIPGPKDVTVQVTDSETPPVSATAEFTFTINSPGGSCVDPGPLSGNYAFYLNGFNSGGAITLAGSFVSDGHGNVTRGSVDGNSLNAQPFTASLTGTYCINGTGLHTLTLHGGSWGPATFVFVLNSGGNGRIIEYDDTTGHGTRGSGELRKASSSAFSLSLLNGSWAMGLTGGNHTSREVEVGALTLTNGTISNGACDVNGDGGFQTCTFTGSVTSIDAQSGRGLATVHSSFGDTRHQAVYVVSASEAIMAQTDPTPGTGIQVLAGMMEKQTGPFNNASLSGNDLTFFQAIHGSDGLDQSGAGIVHFDGLGNFNITSMDEDLAGTITQDAPQQGTYTVRSNGAVTLNCSDGCPVGFLWAPNKGMIINQGSSIMFGQFGPQTGGPFSNSSLNGTYAGGSLPPLDYLNANNELDTLSVNGAGSMTMNGVSSGPDGLDQFFGGQATYNIAANGRGTAISPGDQAPAIMYVGSPTLFVIMMPKSDARIDLFQH